MPPIGISVVGIFDLQSKTIGVTFRSILESTIEASKAALIVDTRQKGLFYLYYKLHLQEA